MRKKMILASLIVVTTISLFGYNFYRLNKSIPVEMAAAVEGAIRESVYASGKLEPRRENLLYVPLSGEVEQVLVRPGDRVKAGQTLLVMENGEVEDQILLEANNREMILAEQNHYRKQSLDTARQQLQAGKDAKELINEDELDIFRLRLERSDLIMSGLRKKLELRELKADMDGVVTEVSIKEGQSASQGTPAFRIIQDRDLRVKAYLNELDTGKVKQGMEATVTGDSFEGAFHGKVTYLSPIASPADPTSRDSAVELWVDVDGAHDELRPGFQSTIEIVVTEEPHLLLPLSAVRQDGEKFYVYAVQDGLAVKKEVRVGKDDGEQVEILEGLADGDEAIKQLSNDISDGKKVKPR